MDLIFGVLHIILSKIKKEWEKTHGYNNSMVGRKSFSPAFLSLHLSIFLTTNIRCWLAT